MLYSLLMLLHSTDELSVRAAWAASAPFERAPSAFTQHALCACIMLHARVFYFAKAKAVTQTRTRKHYFNKILHCLRFCDRKIAITTTMITSVAHVASKSACFHSSIVM